MTSEDLVERVAKAMFDADRGGFGGSKAPELGWDRTTRDAKEIYTRLASVALSALREAQGEYAFPLGTKVQKLKGYPFPGTVVAAFDTLAGEARYVVESDLAPGMLHIFSASNLAAIRADGEG